MVVQDQHRVTLPDRGVRTGQIECAGNDGFARLGQGQCIGQVDGDLGTQHSDIGLSIRVQFHRVFQPPRISVDMRPVETVDVLPGSQIDHAVMKIGVEQAMTVEQRLAQIGVSRQPAAQFIGL